MSDLISAAKQALEALDGVSEPYDVLKAQQALRQAIEQAEKQEPRRLGTYEHKCPNVTGHRGPGFVCQKAGHGVSQDSYCNDCTCNEALESHPQPKAEQEPVADIERDCNDCKHKDFGLIDGGCGTCHGRINFDPITSPQPQKPITDWVSIDKSLPDRGDYYLVTVATDERPHVDVLLFDAKNKCWVHEGKPTFCHSYYFEPTHWAMRPEAAHNIKE